MSDLLKYNEIFCEIFDVDESQLNENFSSETVEKWDSVMQLSLVTSIEETFDIMLEPEDIMDFKSYSKGIEILSRNGIDLMK